MSGNVLYPADWHVSFPSSCDAALLWSLLEETLLCRWSWDNFLWDLGKLHPLLAECPPSFEYLSVTRFLKARAVSPLRSRKASK